jgi:uncharacterized protein YdiU (UPF0061 family)
MWRLESSYAQLPDAFHERATPATFRAPRLVSFNEPLARELGLDLSGEPREQLAKLFSGQELPPGAKPIAQAYGGHQFGHFAMLGDGRALLLGEQRTPDGRLFDIAFKGSGQTSYSRRGDGRAALGPMLRELVVGESMHALGIPTTRALAVVATGEPVMREGMPPGAVLTRVAASHLRVGTFQYAAAWHKHLVHALADYAIARHDPQLLEAPRPHVAFLRAVALRQARLIARWQMVGFIHGVMNTDNTSISGETIDYGPCAFMDAYDPDTVFSSIDQDGRYRYAHQPAIGQWNLARLAEALLPLLAPKEEQAIDAAHEVLEEYRVVHEREWLAGMRAKLGLATAEDGDRALVEELLARLHATRADWTIAFRSLSTGAEPPLALSVDPAHDAWLERWRARLAREGRSVESARASMVRVNPAIVARNHRVEEALYAAERRADLQPLHALLDALRRPFDPIESDARYVEAPPASFKDYQTFCGT